MKDTSLFWNQRRENMRKNCEKNEKRKKKRANPMIKTTLVLKALTSRNFVSFCNNLIGTTLHNLQTVIMLLEIISFKCNKGFSSERKTKPTTNK